MAERYLLALSLRVSALLLTCGLFTACLPAQSQATPTGATGSTGDTQVKIDWHKGPYTAKLGNVAEIKVPAGYEFADGDGARKYLEATGNPASNKELGIMTPTASDKANDWWVLFDFDSIGYVKDDEKGSIEPAKLLDEMKRGTEEDNEFRKKRGWKSFHLIDWQIQPFYDEHTHNLTWATIGQTDDPKDDKTVNYATRVLGRHGVMRTDLIIDPSQTAAIDQFNNLMTGFNFTAGDRYADFMPGDKVAAYGLTALIAGGATAVAMKSGLLAKLVGLLAGLWKLIAVGFAALMTRAKNIVRTIKSKFSKGGDGTPPVEEPSL